MTTLRDTLIIWTCIVWPLIGIILGVTELTVDIGYPKPPCPASHPYARTYLGTSYCSDYRYK
jgi:hypothetical protein